MIELLKKYRAFIAYAVFGVLTTAINIVTYAVCYEHLHIANVPSNILAWTFAVAFAFITNKLWVFGSKNMSVRTILNELWKFITARLAVGLVDLAITPSSMMATMEPSMLCFVFSCSIQLPLVSVVSLVVEFSKVFDTWNVKSVE